jgi:hypothetical protein
MKKDKDLKRLDKAKFLFVETTIRNRKGNVLYHGTSFIPEFHEDYNITIDRYGLGIKYSK